jgi:hypothetical protein
MKIKNIKILGGSQQFADTIVNNSNQLLTTEKSFLELIHKNTNSEEDRAELIKSLEIVKDSETDLQEKKKSGSLLKKFLESTTNEAGKQIIKELIEQGVNYIEYLI